MKAVYQLIAVALLTGCGMLPTQKRTVVLAPHVAIAASQAGQNKKVFVAVLDKRADRVLYCPGDQGNPKWVISLEPDLNVAVTDAVKKGLTRHGFQVLQESQPGVATLEIEIRALDYQLGSGQWAMKTKIVMAARTEVTHGQVKTFEKMFNAVQEKTVVLYSREWDTEQINAVLANLLNQLLTNKNLLEALAK